jgi:predicted DNA-binding transcriptional regulator AlpA
MNAPVALRRPVPRIGLNRAELALAIGFSENTVDTMIAEGFLPRPRMWRKRKVWLLAEVEASMSEWPTDLGEADEGEGGNYFDEAAA